MSDGNSDDDFLPSSFKKQHNKRKHANKSSFVENRKKRDQKSKTKLNKMDTNSETSSEENCETSISRRRRCTTSLTKLMSSPGKDSSSEDEHSQSLLSPQKYSQYSNTSDIANVYKLYDKQPSIKSEFGENSSKSNAGEQLESASTTRYLKRQLKQERSPVNMLGDSSDSDFTRDLVRRKKRLKHAKRNVIKSSSDTDDQFQEVFQDFFKDRPADSKKAKTSPGAKVEKGNEKHLPDNNSIFSVSSSGRGFEANNVQANVIPIGEDGISYRVINGDRLNAVDFEYKVPRIVLHDVLASAKGKQFTDRCNLCEKHNNSEHKNHPVTISRNSDNCKTTKKRKGMGSVKKSELSNDHVSIQDIGIGCQTISKCSGYSISGSSISMCPDKVSEGAVKIEFGDSKMSEIQGMKTIKPEVDTAEIAIKTEGMDDIDPVPDNVRSLPVGEDNKDKHMPKSDMVEEADEDKDMFLSDLEENAVEMESRSEDSLISDSDVEIIKLDVEKPPASLLGEKAVKGKKLPSTSWLDEEHSQKLEMDSSDDDMLFTALAMGDQAVEDWDKPATPTMGTPEKGAQIESVPVTTETWAHSDTSSSVKLNQEQVCSGTKEDSKHPGPAAPQVIQGLNEKIKVKYESDVRWTEPELRKDKPSQISAPASNSVQMDFSDWRSHQCDKKPTTSHESNSSSGFSQSETIEILSDDDDLEEESILLKLSQTVLDTDKDDDLFVFHIKKEQDDDHLYNTNSALSRADAGTGNNLFSSVVGEYGQHLATQPFDVNNEHEGEEPDMSCTQPFDVLSDDEFIDADQATMHLNHDDIWTVSGDTTGDNQHGLVTKGDSAEGKNLQDTENLVVEGLKEEDHDKDDFTQKSNLVSRKRYQFCDKSSSSSSEDEVSFVLNRPHSDKKESKRSEVTQQSKSLKSRSHTADPTLTRSIRSIHKTSKLCEAQPLLNRGRRYSGDDRRLLTGRANSAEESHILLQRFYSKHKEKEHRSKKSKEQQEVPAKKKYAGVKKGCHVNSSSSDSHKEKMKRHMAAAKKIMSQRQSSISSVTPTSSAMKPDKAKGFIRQPGPVARKSRAWVTSTSRQDTLTEDMVASMALTLPLTSKQSSVSKHLVKSDDASGVKAVSAGHAEKSSTTEACTSGTVFVPTGLGTLGISKVSDSGNGSAHGINKRPNSGDGTEHVDLPTSRSLQSTTGQASKVITSGNTVEDGTPVSGDTISGSSLVSKSMYGTSVGTTVVVSSEGGTAVNASSALVSKSGITAHICMVPPVSASSGISVGTTVVVSSEGGTAVNASSALISKSGMAADTRMVPPVSASSGTSVGTTVVFSSEGGRPVNAKGALVFRSGMAADACMESSSEGRQTANQSIVPNSGNSSLKSRSNTPPITVASTTRRVAVASPMKPKSGILKVTDAREKSDEVRVKSRVKFGETTFREIPARPPSQSHPHPVNVAAMVCDSHPNKKKKTFTEIKFLVELLSKFNTVWLKECLACDSEPPAAGSKVLYPLLGSYSSVEDYIDIITPLMLHEIWAQAARDWKERRKELPCRHMALVNCDFKATAANGYMYHGLQDVIHKTALLRTKLITEGDLVLIQIARKCKTGAIEPLQVFGYVQKITRSVVQKDHYLNKLLAKQMLPGISPDEYTLFTVRVMTKWKPAFSELTDEILFQTEVVTSLTSCIRCIRGLSYLGKSSLARDFLRPTNDNAFVRPSSTFTGCLKGFNESQSKAIESLSEAAVQPYALPKIGLVQGPPGTGKSRTVVSLCLRILKKAHRMGLGHYSILLCAPSNAAIDILTKRLLDYRARMKMQGKEDNRIKVVRVGSPGSAHPDIMPITLDELVKINMDKEAADSLSKSNRSMREALSDLEVKIRTIMNKIEGERNVGKDTSASKKELRHWEAKKKWLCKQPAVKTNLGPKEMAMRQKQIRLNILKNADIVCCTLNSSGNGVMTEAFLDSQNETRKLLFDCVIVDEASQSTELECLIPLQYGCSKLFLIGDPEQLPPTVLSQVSTERNFGQSLLERLIVYFRGKDKNPPVQLLDIQYRMHPEISQFPSRHSYNGLMKADLSNESRSKNCPFQPYLVFNLQDSKENNNMTGAIFNEKEAEFTLDLCKLLHEKMDSFTTNIGVITPYQKQKKWLEDRLKMIHLLGREIEVNTVDGFQGREKGIIVLTCVRAQTSSGGIGFLASRKRMNVALTRAKHALYVVGHLDTLKVDEDWRTLIEDANTRGLIVNVDTETSQKKSLIRKCLRNAS